MKLMTINAHSLQEENYEQKLQWLAEGILREMPAVVAMQEVNQTMDRSEISPEFLQGQVAAQHRIPVREDNHAARLAEILRKAGVSVSWAWLPVKIGFGKYDEGVAVFALHETISTVKAVTLSKTDDYSNWRTRMALGVQLAGRKDWYYSVHMGWWDDEEDPFMLQWEKLEEAVKSQKQAGNVWLMGDFNAPDCARNCGYDTVLASGWQDTFRCATSQCGDRTVPGIIAGWEDRVKEGEGMRLDYIFSSGKVPVVRSKTVFDGGEYPVVSDHYGVLVEVEDF